MVKTVICIKNEIVVPPIHWIQKLIGCFIVHSTLEVLNTTIHRRVSRCSLIQKPYNYFEICMNILHVFHVFDTRSEFHTFGSLNAIAKKKNDNINSNTNSNRAFSANLSCSVLLTSQAQLETMQTTTVKEQDFLNQNLLI